MIKHTLFFISIQNDDFADAPVMMPWSHHGLTGQNHPSAVASARAPPRQQGQCHVMWRRLRSSLGSELGTSWFGKLPMVSWYDLKWCSRMFNDCPYWLKRLSMMFHQVSWCLYNIDWRCLRIPNDCQWWLKMIHDGQTWSMRVDVGLG